MRLSLRARVTFGIVLLVVATLLASWFVATRRVVTPFASEVRGAFADQAVYIAERWASGEPEAALEQAFGVEIEPRVRPPRDEGRRVRRPGRPPVVVPDEGNALYVRTERGWVAVSVGLDLERPRRQFGAGLLAAGAVLVILAAGIAAASTRPLEVTRTALRRVGSGDLSYRLEESGPTELVEVAVAFNAMTSRVESLLVTERELLAGVSHELRTPLTRLRLALELLRDIGPTAARLDAMEADLAELDELIGELLELSRMQLGDTVVARASVDLLALAHDVAEGHERVSVTGSARTVDGDARLLRRAVDNLVRNALRHAPEGPIEVRVEPDAVVVADRGPGVPEEALPRLFEPFYRVDRSRDRRTGGVGLGLLIVRQVAELHGGSASAANRAGGGLEVRLTL